MSYRVVKIEDCEICGGSGRDEDPDHRCYGCQGDGTRMVDVARVERDVELRWNGEREVTWVEVEP